MRAALVFGFTILTVFQTISSHAPNDDPAVKECTTELNLAPGNLIFLLLSRDFLIK